MKTFNEYDEIGVALLDMFETVLKGIEAYYGLHVGAPHHDIARWYLEAFTEYKPLEEDEDDGTEGTQDVERKVTTLKNLTPQELETLAETTLNKWLAYKTYEIKEKILIKQLFDIKAHRQATKDEEDGTE